MAGAAAAINEKGRYLGFRFKAETALVELCESRSTPPNVRAAAARTLLELVGAIGARSKREEDQELTNKELEPEALTVDEIDRELARIGEV